MKSHLIRAALAAMFVVTLSWSSPVRAQGGLEAVNRRLDALEKAVANPQVRVIDFGYILKNHTRFKGQTEELKQEDDRLLVDVKGKKEKLDKLKQQIEARKPGTDERKALEEELVKTNTQYTLEMNDKRKQLADREAKIFYTTYKEIQDEVAYYCKVKNVNLVVIYSSEPLDPNNRLSIQRALMYPVLVQRDIDITETILRVLNRDSRVGEKRPGPADIEGPPRR